MTRWWSGPRRCTPWPAGGKLDTAYGSELARTAGALNTSGLAMVVSAIAATPNADRALVAGLLETMWSRVHVLARNGAPAYAGLADFDTNALILPSETRSLAEVTRAVALATPEEPRLALLRGGLVALGGPEGWGSTNADAAALRALATSWEVAAADVPVTVGLPEGAGQGVGQGARQATLGRAVPMARWTTAQPGPMRVANGGGRPVLALQQAAYVPAAPGWQAAAEQHGFVLTRTLQRVPGGNAPMAALAPGGDGAVHMKDGDVIEETAELVNPEARSMVAVELPIAAGLEPLNPNLATAPAEATPSAGPTLAPAYTAFGDDTVLYVYETLPAGTYRFHFRARAGTVGSFTEPPGTAEMMYRQGVSGASAGLRVVVAP
jgi:alpha-2-macroglobulin